MRNRRLPALFPMAVRPANRSGVELGKQRFLCQQWIGIARIGIGRQATPYAKAAQAANDLAGDALYLLIVRRRQRPETRPPVYVGVVDAVENDRVSGPFLQKTSASSNVAGMSCAAATT